MQLYLVEFWCSAMVSCYWVGF